MGTQDTEILKAPSTIKGAESFTLNLQGRLFHFIGVGGVGMSGLARLLVKHKAIVSGSDSAASVVTDDLSSAGVSIKIGHNGAYLNDKSDAVVVSAAIDDDNPELVKARELGVRVYKYAEMLGAIFNSYDGIAIAGTHGKSTTSGWLSYCLESAGLSPNYIVGADITQLGGSSGIGSSKYFVAEACEYDRSFLNLKPKIGCILNIEQDHLDYYRDEAEIVGAFADFAGGIDDDGVLIANGQDSNVAKVTGAVRRNLRVETFGLTDGCNYYASNIRLKDGLYTFDINHNGEALGAVRIHPAGRHNILNCLATAAMLLEAGLETDEVLRQLEGFVGIDRRMMLKGVIDGITILDDYAHHPTEIRASLEAIRERYHPERLWCIFQPHQYSRTRFLLDDFAKSFKLADITILPEIYFVRDSSDAKKEVNSQMLVDRIRSNGADAMFIDGFEKICSYINGHVRSGDLVVTMGAGDIWKVADEYIQWLGRNSRNELCS